MKYFDAHTHVNFVAFNDDRDAAIKRALDAGVEMNVVGTMYETSKRAIEIAEQYEGVYATIGLHPIHTSKSFHDEKELGEGNKEFTSRGEKFDIEKYVALGQHKKVIAIGECGLDYYRLDEHTKGVQTQAFIEHIEVANRLNKPLMLHIRDGQHGPSSAKASEGKGGESAYLDALEILKAHAQVKGDVHFFAGSLDVARKFLDFGFTLSFTGVVTFTHEYDEVVRFAPLDMLLSETDAPYITPVPHRGKRNEPIYVTEIVKAIARIRGADEETVAEQLIQNARRVFSL